MKLQLHHLKILITIALAVLLSVLATPWHAARADAPGTWTGTGPMQAARTNHTATLLADGRVLLAGPYNAAEIFDPNAGPQGTFSATGSMSRSRYQASSTLLPDGKVLVAGGTELSQTGSTPLATAELYDPAAGSFSLTGSMGNSRWQHSATLLADGKVLITGGLDASHRVVGAAEIFDPATGAFMALSHALITPRYAHTATRLGDGRVLIVGGRDADGKAMQSAEIYDPTTNAFYLAGTPYSSRSEHAATLLRDGKVLITGGQDHMLAYLDSAEIYDPATNTIDLVFLRPMTAARMNHTATLLPDGRVLIAGGENGNGWAASTEIFDPVQSSFTATGSMAGGRAWHTATPLANGKVLVAGGYAASALASAELYCPDCGVINRSGVMATARSGHTSTVLADGTVLIAGGYNPAAGYYLDTAEIYDPATGAYTATGTMPRPRGYHTATRLPDGRVLLVGGSNRTYTRLSSADIYDPVSKSFTFAALTAVARSGHTATLVNGSVLIIGGEGPATTISSVERFSTNQFQTIGQLRSKRVGHTVTPLSDGSLLVAGGSSSLPAEIYRPGTGTSTRIGSLADNRRYHTAMLLADGKVLISGGETIFTGSSQNISLPTAELFDPATSVFARIAGMNAARTGHTATLLANGNVLLAGGVNKYFDNFSQLQTEYLSSMETYDPATGTHAYAAFLEAARTGHTASLLPNCKVLIAGGTDGLELASSEVFKTAVCGSVPCGPAIQSVSPLSGPTGTTVTITGSGFGDLQGGSIVTFNGVGAGAAARWTDTSITIVVPNGAGTGPLVVTVYGVPSNAVPFTVNSACATNVSAQIAVVRGGFRYNRITRRYVQQVTLTNTGGTSIAGPLVLVLDGLSSGATLENRTGNTSCATPVSPYIAANIGVDNAFGPGEAATASLEFSNPANTAINYTTRLLSGASH